MTSSSVTKVCRKCGEVKPLTEFWADRKAKDGKQSSCKPCNYAQTEKWKRENPDKHRANKRRQAARQLHNHRKWKYGITMEQYEAMVEERGGLCDICRRPSNARGLYVDHDHASGVVRGLLCSGCNTGLGQFGDSIEGLMRAIDYLQRSSIMASGNIKATSKAPDVQILKQGHTTNGDFGSDPNAKVKGGRTTRDITVPTARG